MDVFFYEHQKLIFSSRFVKGKIWESRIFSSGDCLEIHLSKNIEIQPCTLCGLLYGDAVYLRIKCLETSTHFLLESTAANFEDKKNFFLEVYEKLDAHIQPRIKMRGGKIAKIFREMKYSLFPEKGKIIIDSPIKLIFCECRGVYIFKNLRGDVISKDNDERKVFLESGKYFDDEKKMLAKNSGGEYFSFVKKIILSK